MVVRRKFIRHLADVQCTPLPFKFLSFSVVRQKNTITQRACKAHLATNDFSHNEKHHSIAFFAMLWCFYLFIYQIASVKSQT